LAEGWIAIKVGLAEPDEQGPPIWTEQLVQRGLNGCGSTKHEGRDVDLMLAEHATIAVKSLNLFRCEPLRGRTNQLETDQMLEIVGAYHNVQATADLMVMQS